MNEDDRKPVFPKLPEGYFWRVQDGAVGDSTKLGIYRDFGDGLVRAVDSSENLPNSKVTVSKLEIMAAQMHVEFLNTRTAQRLRGDYRP